MTLYVVSLYRGGFRDNSSFPLGVFSTREKAERAGRRECTGRGYKYGYEISELKLDHYEEDGPLDEIIQAHGNPDWRDG